MAFVRFVEWPAVATAGGDGAVVICQPTETPELDLAGKQVRGQVLLVMRIARPRDIERALGGDLDVDETRRNLQVEARAHIRVQREVDRLHAAGELPEPASREFIRWLHRDPAQ